MSDQDLASHLGPAHWQIQCAIKERLLKRAQEPSDRLEQVTEVLVDLSKRLSTRSLGRFPDFYPDINSLLATATSEIHIACDFVTYAIFSAPNEHERYVDTLVAKSKAGVSTKIAVLGPNARKELLHRQIGSTGEQWQLLLDNPEFATRLSYFCRRQHCKVDSITSFEAEVEKLQGEMGDVLKNLANISVHQHLDHMPLHVWIVDRERAVFAIPRLSFGQYASEHGFDTRDASLVRTLQANWDNIWTGVGPVMKMSPVISGRW